MSRGAGGRNQIKIAVNTTTVPENQEIRGHGHVNFFDNFTQILTNAMEDMRVNNSRWARFTVKKPIGSVADFSCSK
jgi:hypothetical protein